MGIPAENRSFSWLGRGWKRGGKRLSLSMEAMAGGGSEGPLPLPMIGRWLELGVEGGIGNQKTLRMGGFNFKCFSFGLVCN
jgi:hypothetical protein